MKYVLLLIICVFCYISCNDPPPIAPTLPQTEAISLRKDWAVISFPYLPLYQEAHIDADVLYLARRADVFIILDQSLKREELYKQEEHWYYLRHDSQEGWAFGAGINYFATEAEARNEAASLEGRNNGITGR